MQLFYDPEHPLIPEHALCSDVVIEAKHVRCMIVGCHAIRIWDAIDAEVGGGAVDIYEVPRDTIKDADVIQGAFFEGRKPILSIRLPDNGNYRYTTMHNGSWALWIGNVMLMVNHKCIVTEKRRKSLRVSFSTRDHVYCGGEEGNAVISRIIDLAKLNYTIKPCKIDYHGHGEWEFRVCPYTSFNTDLSVAKKEIVSLMDTIDQIQMDDELQVKLNICDLEYKYCGDYYVDNSIYNDERDFHNDRDEVLTFNPNGYYGW